MAARAIRSGVLALGAAAALCAGGCLQRTISITSTPAGAIVWLNDQELGRTPLETDFTFYGVYDVRLKLEGYEPAVTSRKASQPIYEWAGLDLISEAIPATIRTKISWHFDLAPSLISGPASPEKETAENDLVERAKKARSDVERGR